MGKYANRKKPKQNINDIINEMQKRDHNLRTDIIKKIPVLIVIGASAKHAYKSILNDCKSRIVKI